MIKQVEEKENIIELFGSFPKKVIENLKIELEQVISKFIYGFIYVHNGKIIGYIVLRKWGGVYWLDTLVVSSDFRNRGVGKLLVEFTKKKCIEENITQLNVCTFYEENHSFFEKLEFIKIGELEGPFMPLDKKRVYLKWVVDF
jgi:N-acetylglutamate synthase-like GNAT family acetyltransferase